MVSNRNYTFSSKAIVVSLVYLGIYIFFFKFNKYFFKNGFYVAEIRMHTG